MTSASDLDDLDDYDPWDDDEPDYSEPDCPCDFGEQRCPYHNPTLRQRFIEPHLNRLRWRWREWRYPIRYDDEAPF